MVWSQGSSAELRWCRRADRRRCALCPWTSRSHTSPKIMPLMLICTFYLGKTKSTFMAASVVLANTTATTSSTSRALMALVRLYLRTHYLHINIFPRTLLLYFPRYLPLRSKVQRREKNEKEHFYAPTNFFHRFFYTMYFFSSYTVVRTLCTKK